MGMIPVYQYFVFDGKSSRDFEVFISGNGTFSSPERDVEIISVPGRNGDLTIDGERFNNIKVTYPAFIVKDFRQNFDAFKAFMGSRHGYKKLADSYHPEYYRLAQFSESINPDMTTLNRAGSFDIVFNCDPRRFLKDGDRSIELTAGGSLNNKTLYTSKPLIRCYGTGTLTVNGVSVTITSANVYTDIDSEIEAAYKGSTNCNGNVTFGSTYKTFPTLTPGINTIAFTGFSKIEITPRFWTV